MLIGICSSTISNDLYIKFKTQYTEIEISTQKKAILLISSAIQLPSRNDIIKLSLHLDSRESKNERNFHPCVLQCSNE